VQSVIHTHPPYAAALSASGRPLRCVSQPSALFFDALPVYSDTVALIRTPVAGKGVATALGPHRAVLLKSHGVAVVGASIEEAVINVIMLETAAKVQMIAAAASDAGPEFPRADIEKLKQEISQPEQFVINFNYLARRVERKAEGGDWRQG
jgi:L-fuculose-phosphate aldolase